MIRPAPASTTGIHGAQAEGPAPPETQAEKGQPHRDDEQLAGIGQQEAHERPDRESHAGQERRQGGHGCSCARESCRKTRAEAPQVEGDQEPGQQEERTHVHRVGIGAGLQARDGAEPKRSTGQ